MDTNLVHLQATYAAGDGRNVFLESFWEFQHRKITQSFEKKIMKISLELFFIIFSDIPYAKNSFQCDLRLTNV